MTNPQMTDEFQPRPWMSSVLKAAGVYNLVWGVCVVLFPAATLRLLGYSAPLAFPQLWQCIGMMVGVYGVGYWVSAWDPYRHWPIVLVGLLGKILGPIGFLLNILAGDLPASMGWTILTNDLVWWIPFGMILWGAVRHHAAMQSAYARQTPLDDPFRELPGTTGRSLAELSCERPQLVVLLRHAGCTFCRESLGDLRRDRASIESAGMGIVLVHVGEEGDIAELISGYGLGDLPRISDPGGRLYRQFGLELGRFSQLFGAKVWLRGFRSSLVDGHGFGAIRGNPLQMPGAFVVHQGRCLRGFQHESAGDRPDYLRLVRATSESEPAVVV